MSASASVDAASIAADSAPMEDVDPAPAPAASPSPSPSSSSKRTGASSPAAADADSDSASFAFPSVPPLPLPDKKAANGQTTLSSAATWREFKLPPAFFVGRAEAAAEAKEAEAAKVKSAKKPKGAAAAAASGDGAAAAAGSSKVERKPKSLLDKSKKTKEELEAERVLPDPAAASPLDSFQRLVSSVRGLPIEQLRMTTADGHSVDDADSDAAAAASSASMPAELAVSCLAEVPAISHFTWLFQKQLYLRPIEPSRLESLLLAPDSVVNESLASELLSKLLYATRAHYPKSFRKRLELMQKGQRCFHYQLLCEWLFWLVEIWIETWKRRCKREEERKKSGGGGQEDAEGEGAEGADGAAAAAADGGDDGAAPRKKRKYTRKSVGAAADSDSDGDAESEDPEEATAYDLHTLPERSFIVNTEELCGNVNPFAPAVTTTTPRAASASVQQDGEEKQASASSSAAAAAGSASPATAAGASTPTPVTVSSAGHKLLHETPLSFRAALLQTLCDFQLAVNPALSSAVRHDIESKDLHLNPLGRDAYGRFYFYSGFSDYRIYVRGHVDMSFKLVKTAEEIEADRKKKEAIEAEQKAIRHMADEILAKKAAEQKAEEEAKKRKKLQKEAEMNLDEDAPLSSLQHLQQKPPMSSLAALPPPLGSNAAVAAAAAAASSVSATSAADSASSVTAAGAAAALAPVLENSPGLPFRLREPDVNATVERRQLYAYPSAPPFALVASSGAEIRTLVSHIQSQRDPRNSKLISDLLAVVEELDAGRGRADADEEANAKLRKKELAAPKRISDRLVTQELAREEAERLRLIKWEEESRSRNTRRNRWLDDVAQRTLARVRRSFERLIGVERKKADADADGEAEGDESSGDDGDDGSSYQSQTDDEDAEVRRTNRRSGGSGRANGSGGRSRGSRVTRNQGRATASMAESETESEAEGGDDGAGGEDDEGCAKCGVVEPTDANPIILCDRCDKQMCLRCIPLDKVPQGKFFCNECIAANPRLR